MSFGRELRRERVWRNGFCTDCDALHDCNIWNERWLRSQTDKSIPQHSSSPVLRIAAVRLAPFQTRLPPPLQPRRILVVACRSKIPFASDHALFLSLPHVSTFPSLFTHRVHSLENDVFVSYILFHPTRSDNSVATPRQERLQQAAAPPTDEATSVDCCCCCCATSTRARLRGHTARHDKPADRTRRSTTVTRAASASPSSQAGAMPVLPLLSRRIQDAASSIAEDTRIIDSRQLEHGVAVIQKGAKALLKRIPALVDRALHGSAEAQQAAALQRRQDANVCSAGYIAGCYQGLNAGPAPGAVVGIVLGSVAGFLLLLWVLFTLSSGSGFIRTSGLHEEDIVNTTHSSHRHRSRSPRRSNHRSTYRAEMRQTHTSPAPAARRDRVVRQERISRDVPRDVSRSRVRETIIVDSAPPPERRVDGDDVIEVIAEGSDMTSAAPPPRRKSGRKSSGYRSVHQSQKQRSRSSSRSLSPDPKIESGYRRVDPSRFAGGGFRQHRV